MDEAFIIDLGRRALLMVLIVGLPIMGLTLVTGLLISVLQASTQVYEQTLVFVPKIIAALVAVALFGSWMTRELVDFSRELFVNVPMYIR